MTHRRNLNQALASPELNDAAAAFLSGKPAQHGGNIGNVEQLPRGTGFDLGAVPASGRHSTNEATVRGSVSVSFRLPSEMAARLLQAALERKLRRVEPFTQQAILADALEAWLKKHEHGR